MTIHRTGLYFQQKKDTLQRFYVKNCQYQKNIMRNNFLLVLVAVAGLFVACSKTTSQKNKEVLVRVENATDEDFSNFTFMGTDFGSINSGGSTGYKTFQQVIRYPFANDLTINQQHLYIIDVVAGLYLENGKYTLRVVNDTSFHYGASFIKE